MAIKKSTVEALNTQHLLVVGGTGFIGHHLLKMVKKKCWKLTSVSLNPPSEERFVSGVRYLHFDMVDQRLVNKYLDDESDHVVNLGGYINHQLFQWILEPIILLFYLAALKLN